MRNVRTTINNAIIGFALTVGIAHAQPTCKTVGILTVCTEVQSSGQQVSITVQSLEDQNVYLPIVAYWLEGRVRLADGSLFGFKVEVQRADWLGQNGIVLTIPTGVASAVGMDRLSVLPLREEIAQIVE